MRRLALAVLLALAACGEDAPPPRPVALTPEAVGYFCQMNVVEHPGPKAQVHLEDLPGKPLFFSQVRDAVAYVRMPEHDHRILAIYVNDMGAAPSWEEPGTTNWIPIAEATFVVGSSKMGAMGTPEFVPFANPARAAEFAAANGGNVVTLANISDDLVFAAGKPGSADPGADDYAGRLRALANSAGD